MIKIQKNIPLNDKNWFNIGGPAKHFCEPISGEEFRQAIEYASEEKLDITPLGLGANMLISDDGIDGLVIRPQLKEISHTIKSRLDAREQENTCSYPSTSSRLRQSFDEHAGRPVSHSSESDGVAQPLMLSEGSESKGYNKRARGEPAGSIRAPFQKQSHDDALVTVGCGVTIEELIEYCLENNLIGLEEFSGIPGTIGGAVFINVHYFQYNLQQFIAGGTILEKATGKISKVDRDWFQFGYDQSKLHEKKHYLINATFKLKKVSEIDTAYAKGRSTEIIRHRITRYPYKGTCGCFFRNFHDDEVSLKINGKKMIYASYYLDKLGIKGELSIGGARISHQHANMIVNTGNATAYNVIMLARKMQELVQKKYGILPQTECQLVGFKEHPLLKTNFS